MKRWKWLPFLVVLVAVAWVGASVAQELPVLWEDHFEDDDPPAHKNVGWLYYGEEDGLKDQVIQQQQVEGSGVLYIKSGNYSVVGVGLVETNGVPEVDPDDPAKTHRLLVANNYSSPNQLTTFRVNFKSIQSSIFVAAARMVQTDTSETIPDADPTESPAYVVFVSPLEGKVRLAKYEGEMAALRPDTWAYFGEADFSFDMDVWYWFKFLLNEGDFKVKIWEGEPSDEPAEWLLEVQDPEPRVTGKFNMFALFGQPPGGDEMMLDDIVVRSPATGVAEESGQVPAKFDLAQNYPNPFNPTTEIVYSLPEAGNVTLAVYNSQGQLVRTLVNGRVTTGSHTVTFDGRDDQGRALASGVYIYRLTAGDKVLQKKMMLLK